MSPLKVRNHGRHAAPSPSRTRLIVPALLVIMGVFVMLYPVITTVWNNQQAAHVAEEYSRLDNDISQETKNQEWEEAKRYNNDHATGPILDPWINKVRGKSSAYENYLQLLDSNTAMARLVIPHIQVDLPIYHGTDNETLQKGLGHLYGSDLPVGGDGTHSVITGHTGLPNATMFDNLRDVKEGDSFFIQVSGHKLKYTVDQIQVVLPEEVDSLKTGTQGDYVTLITCTPYGINTHRLLVRGHAAPITSEDAQVFDQVHAQIWAWWMYLLIAAAGIALLLLVRWLIKQHRAINKRGEIAEPQAYTPTLSREINDTH
nr:class C sortase [Corynebacterium ulceribovis]